MPQEAYFSDYVIFHSIKSIPVDNISESLRPQTGVEPLPVVPEALCDVLRLGDGRHVGSHDDPGVQPERVRLLRRRDVMDGGHYLQSRIYNVKHSDSWIL